MAKQIQHIYRIYYVYKYIWEVGKSQICIKTQALQFGIIFYYYYYTVVQVQV